jgi:hypothetical protein
MRTFNLVGVGGHHNSLSYTLHNWLIYFSTNFTNDDGILTHLEKINHDVTMERVFNSIKVF